MLLLIKRNLLIFFSKIWYLILAMLCICIFFFTQYNSLKYFDNNFIYIISGVDNTVGTFLLISLTLVINSIYLLYTYYLYSYDIFKCKEAIFLRISYKKWITANIISNCIIDFIISLITITLLLIYSFVVNTNVEIGIITLIIIYLSKLAMQFIYLLIIKFTGNYGSILMFLILLIGLLFKTKSIIYIYSLTSSLNNYIILLILLTINVVLILINIYLKDNNLVMRGEMEK